MHLVDGQHHGPQLLGVHRLVRDLPDDVEQRLACDFQIVATAPDPAALARAVQRGIPGSTAAMPSVAAAPVPNSTVTPATPVGPATPAAPATPSPGTPPAPPTMAPPPAGAAEARGGRPAEQPSPGRHVLGLWLPGGRARLLVERDDASLSRRLPVDRPAVWRDLDTAVLHWAVLPALGATDVDYRTDVAATVAEVEAARSGGVFVLRPPAIAAVYACAAAGAPMPAKTTSFRPKPRAGLVLRSLDSV